MYCNSILYSKSGKRANIVHDLNPSGDLLEDHTNLSSLPSRPVMESNSNINSGSYRLRRLWFSNLIWLISKSTENSSIPLLPRGVHTPALRLHVAALAVQQGYAIHPVFSSYMSCRPSSTSPCSSAPVLRFRGSGRVGVRVRGDSRHETASCGTVGWGVAV
jgi:hypothetical protein